MIGKNGYLRKKQSDPISQFLTHWPPLGGTVVHVGTKSQNQSL